MIKIVSVDPLGKILMVATSMGAPGEGHHAVPLDSPISPQTHYFTAGEFVEFSAQPSKLHTFDFATKQWADVRDLAQLQVDKWAAIKAQREALVTSPLETPFGAFDANAAAQKSITDAVLMLQTLAGLGTPSTVDFTLADNMVVELDVSQIVQVGLLLGQRTQQVRGIATCLRAAIYAATTAEELNSIAWPQL